MGQQKNIDAMFSDASNSSKYVFDYHRILERSDDKSKKNNFYNLLYKIIGLPEYTYQKAVAQAVKGEDIFINTLMNNCCELNDSIREIFIKNACLDDLIAVAYRYFIDYCDGKYTSSSLSSKIGERIPKENYVLYFILRFRIEHGHVLQFGEIIKLWNESDISQFDFSFLIDYLNKLGSNNCDLAEKFFAKLSPVQLIKMTQVTESIGEEDIFRILINRLLDNFSDMISTRDLIYWYILDEFDREKILDILRLRYPDGKLTLNLDDFANTDLGLIRMG